MSQNDHGQNFLSEVSHHYLKEKVIMYTFQVGSWWVMRTCLYENRKNIKNCFSELLEFFKVKNFNRVTVSGVTKCENSDANWWKFSLILHNQSFFIIFQLKLICWVIFNNFFLHPCRNVVLRAVFACVNAVWKVWVC